MTEAVKVLIIDDDTELGNLMNMALKLSGYDVHFQSSLIGVEAIIEQFAPSIIVLDVEVGREDGIEKANKIVKAYPDIPILFISSHTDIDNIRKGISVGGVGYLKKPFEIQELEVYINRFATKPNSADQLVPIGAYSLNICNQQLIYKEEHIKSLSPMENNGLLLLIKNKNKIVTRQQFYDVLWGTNPESEMEATLNNLISKLRKLLEKDSKITIKTIKYKGYILECHV
jgi:DNA-binding response OmpR family regulator